LLSKILSTKGTTEKIGNKPHKRREKKGAFLLEISEDSKLNPTFIIDAFPNDTKEVYWACKPNCIFSVNFSKVEN
jgi:hypothetical protein